MTWLFCRFRRESMIQPFVGHTSWLLLKRELLLCHIGWICTLYTSWLWFASKYSFTSAKIVEHFVRKKEIHVNPRMQTIFLCTRGLPICKMVGFPSRTYTGSPCMRTGISLWCVSDLSSSQACMLTPICAQFHYAYGDSPYPYANFALFFAACTPIPRPYAYRDPHMQ